MGNIFNNSRTYFYYKIPTDRANPLNNSNMIQTDFTDTTYDQNDYKDIELMVEK